MVSFLDNTLLADGLGNREIEFFQGYDTQIARCLLEYYDLIPSDCCRQAIDYNIIDGLIVERRRYGSGHSNPVAGNEFWNPCMVIANVFEADCDLSEVCSPPCFIRAFNDTEVCNNNLLADCAFDIEYNNCDTTDGNALIACLSNVQSNSSNYLVQCCGNELTKTLNNNATECVITSNYYNYASSVYTIDLCDSNDINIAGCTGSPDIILCLVNSSSITGTSVCCQENIKSITQSNVYTIDCEHDAKLFCSSKTTITGDTTIDTACKNILGTFTNISDHCVSTLNKCEAILTDKDGVWQLTNGGAIAESTCKAGFSGKRTRLCNNNGNFAVWDTIDDSGCVQMFCLSEIDDYNQAWNDTIPGELQRYYGKIDISQLWQNYYTTNVSNDNTVCDSDTLSLELTRRCYVNGTSSLPFWGQPILHCRSSFNNWDNAIYYNNTVCIPNDETSILYGSTIKDITDRTITNTSDISELNNICALYCSNRLTNCIAYEFYYPYNPLFDQSVTSLQGPFCMFYDNCNINNNNNIYYNDATNALISESMNSISNDTNFIIQTYFAPKPLVNSIQEYCSFNSMGSVSATQVWDNNGIPNSQCFSSALWLYITDPNGGVLNQDKILFNDQQLLYDTINGYKSLSIQSTYNTLVINGIDDDDIAVEFLLNLRDYIDNLHDNNNIHIIPGGLLIDLFSQYIGVRESLFQNLLFVCICVAVSGLIFLLNWWSVLVILLCNAAMIFEVYGFSHWFGLRINAVFVLNIIIAVGLTLEFTAHVGRAFVLTPVSKYDENKLYNYNYSQIRMIKTFREMFTPVTLGAITTLLGVIPISLARFPYFRQYYFLLYVIIVVFGFINGMIFQPVILSWLPPTPFINEEARQRLADDIEDSDDGHLTQRNNTGRTNNLKTNTNTNTNTSHEQIEMGSISDEMNPRPSYAM